jgi:hypothetical protein
MKICHLAQSWEEWVDTDTDSVQCGDVVSMLFH